MRQALLGNMSLKILSVLIAFVIWLMVVNGEDPESVARYDNVAIEIQNRDSVAGAGQSFSIENNVQTVTVWVTARRSVQNQLRSSDFTAYVNLEDLNKMNTVPLNIQCNNKAVTQENMRWTPGSLKIKLEDLQESTFSVAIVTSGTPSAEFEVGSTGLKEGDSVIIEGPASIISIIDKVQANVSVEGLEKTRTISSVLTIYDKNGDPFTESQMDNIQVKTSDGVVLTDGEVNVRVRLWKVQKGVRLNVLTTGEIADGYRISAINISPETVNLTGPDSVLEELNGVLTIPDGVDVSGATKNVEATIDLEEFLQENYKRDLRLQSYAATTAAVTVEIEERGTTMVNVPVSDMKIINQPENMNLVLTPADKVSLELINVDGSGGTVTASDVQVTLDLAECQKPGNYTVALVVAVPSGYELRNPVTVVVNLEESNSAVEVEEE